MFLATLESTIFLVLSVEVGRVTRDRDRDRDSDRETERDRDRPIKTDVVKFCYTNPASANLTANKYLHDFVIELARKAAFELA